MLGPHPRELQTFLAQRPSPANHPRRTDTNHLTISMRPHFFPSILLATTAALLPGALGTAAAAPARIRDVRVEQQEFGRLPDGQVVEVFTLHNASGLSVRVMTHGATLIAVETPDRAGNFANITLFLDTFADYLAGHPVFGSVVGRYANRIAGAKFTIDGIAHAVTLNAPPHHIHGGKNGFHKRVWAARPLRATDSAGVELTLASADGEEGFPGALQAKVVYRLTNRDELFMEYTATTDKPTHVNLTNHAYWNLAGAGNSDALGHRLTIHADRYLPSDNLKIPTGELAPVRGTPMDFTTPHTVGERIAQVAGGGYDHCYVVNLKPGETLVAAALVEDPKSGRVMEVFTTEPGVQLYTANHVSDKLKGAGKPYGKHHALCLEAQKYPNTSNQPSFPASLLRPGETYRQVTMHKFTVAK